ncbi:DUF58 domain-containing protein [Bifidobacterium samirii]|uniref:DUF58 domain-containing protein n=1 Tax=Bifidobacterium samirii TaxID=2306974 RepID=UPI0013E0D778|nr:DUF58 domain-containing protein [Bifidobacterium samirii]
MAAALSAALGGMPLSAEAEPHSPPTAQPAASPAATGRPARFPLRVTEGDGIRYDIVIRNTSRRTARGITCIMPYAGPDVRFAVPRLGPGATLRHTVAIGRTRRGVAPIGTVVWERSDPFGLACRSITAAGPGIVVVRPRTVPFDSIGFDRLGDADDTAGHPSEDGDPCGLRQYRDGDDPRRIHWPASLKGTGLVVRDIRSSRRNGIMLTLAIDASRYADAAEFETAVRVFASIGMHALSTGMPLSCQAGNRPVTTTDPDAFLDSCSRITPHGSWDAPSPSPPQASTAQANHDGTGLLPAPVDGANVLVAVVGSTPGRGPDAGIRQSGIGSAWTGPCLRIEVRHGATASLRCEPDVTVGVAGSVDDLPSIMEALS